MTGDEQALLQTIRDAVADVLENEKLISHARRTRIGEMDGSITMLAATTAVDRVLAGIVT